MIPHSTSLSVVHSSFNLPELLYIISPLSLSDVSHPTTDSPVIPGKSRWKRRKTKAPLKTCPGLEAAKRKQ
jgi:hypothetical protein